MKMAIPAAVLYPPFNIVRLSHVVFQVTDLAASRAFYVDTLGLQVTDETADSIYLRGLEERSHHSLVLRRADIAVTEVIGLRVFDEHELDKAKQYFDARNLPNRWIDAPYQGRTLRTVDALGMPIEFFSTMERLPPIHQKYALYKGVK